MMLRQFKTILLLAASLIIAFASAAFAAESGVIQGVVKDAQTGDPLPGANILVVGTSLGASSDLDGSFVIRNVPAGNYKIRTTYIGYRADEEAIEVTAGKTAVVDLKLHAVGVQGKEVVVTAQASGQNQAINQQHSSNQIVNVVSAARIQALPDANAAESLGRLPGISVLRSGGEADQVVIRGMAPKYNEIEINGVRLNSSNQNNASVDLSMISSNMLEGMEVKKTVTPDMDADVIGGVVNLELREAHVEEPGVPVIGLVAQGGYNALPDAGNKFNNYKYVGSFEDRLFNENFGIFAQADVERKNLSSDQLGASYTNLGDQPNSYLTQGLNLDNVPRDRRRYDGALVLDYRLPEGSVKFSNFLSTGTTVAQDRGEYFGIAGGSGSNVHNYSLAYTSTALSVITNSLRIQYQLPIFHVNAEFSHSYTESNDPNDWTVTFQQGSAGLGGLINQPNINPQAIPAAANNNLGLTYLNNIVNYNSFSGARALAGRVDLETNANISSEITSVLKFGGAYRYQTRDYYYNTTGSEGLGLTSASYVDNLIAKHFPGLGSYTNTTQLPMAPFVDSSYSYADFLKGSGSYPLSYPLNFGMLSNLTNFLAQNAGLIQSNPLASASYFHDQFNSTTNNYSGHEIESAAYIMATINVGPRITIIPGVRYQNLETSYRGAQGIESTASGLGGPYNHYDTTVTVNHGYWLPDVAIQYKPLSWFNVRLSYTNTLSYPDFQAIIPRIDVSTAGSIAWNNAGLSPARSTNYDAYLSFYNNTLGLLTVGGFYKRITNLIFPYTFYALPNQVLQYFPQGLVASAPPPTGNYQISTFVNDSIPAVDYGLELDWETHFWYLPYPFNGLLLDVNYTHVFSREKYPYVNATKVGRALEYIDTSYTDPLLYQPDNIANLSLGYDYRGFSIRVSMIYQDNIFSGTNFYSYLRTTTAAYTRWDISAKQDLPWPGIQLYADISNINSENDVQVIQASTGVPQSEQSYGMAADLGLKVKF